MLYGPQGVIQQHLVLLHAPMPVLETHPEHNTAAY